MFCSIILISDFTNSCLRKCVVDVIVFHLRVYAIKLLFSVLGRSRKLTENLDFQLCLNNLGGLGKIKVADLSWIRVTRALFQSTSRGPSPEVSGLSGIRVIVVRVIETHLYNIQDSSQLQNADFHMFQV